MSENQASQGSTEQETDKLAATKPVESPVTIKDVEKPIVSEEIAKMPFTKTFFVEWTNPDDGKTYSGQFTAKRLNLRDMNDLAKIKIHRTGEAWLGATMDMLAEMHAYCTVALVEAPDWWKPDSFYTEEPLTKVWKHIRTWDENFRKRVLAK